MGHRRGRRRFVAEVAAEYARDIVVRALASGPGD
jgi:hypothetical protein